VTLDDLRTLLADPDRRDVYADQPAVPVPAVVLAGLLDAADSDMTWSMVGGLDLADGAGEIDAGDAARLTAIVDGWRVFLDVDEGLALEELDRLTQSAPDEPLAVWVAGTLALSGRPTSRVTRWVEADGQAAVARLR
jgi:hypothetical protein